MSYGLLNYNVRSIRAIRKDTPVKKGDQEGNTGAPLPGDLAIHQGAPPPRFVKRHCTVEH